MKTAILLDPKATKEAGTTRYICLKCKSHSGDNWPCRPCPVEGSPGFRKTCLEEYEVEVPDDYTEQCERRFGGSQKAKDTSLLPSGYPVYLEPEETKNEDYEESEIPF